MSGTKKIYKFEHFWFLFRFLGLTACNYFIFNFRNYL